MHTVSFLVNFHFSFLFRIGPLWGGTPQIRNSFFAGKKIRKGGRGGTPLTDKIRKVVFEVFPYYKVEEGDVVAFYGGLQVVHTNYASDYKIRLNDDTDIDIPQVRTLSPVLFGCIC